jgi:hypothetical protein
MMPTLAPLAMLLVQDGNRVEHGVATEHGEAKHETITTATTSGAAVEPLVGGLE